MKLGKDLKERIRQVLSSPFGSATLVLDGTEVHYQVRSAGQLRFVIMPFVDGKFEYKWLFDFERTHPEQRYLRRTRVRTISKAEFKRRESFNRKMKRLGGKDLTLPPEWTTRFDVFDNADQLIRHLEKEFQAIEIKDDSCD